MAAARAAILIAALAIASTPVAAAKKASPSPAKSLLSSVEFFQIDTPHSEVGFTVPWMGVSRVRGTFDEFSGTIALDTVDFARSSVTLVIRTPSLDTGFERRDTHLKSADFFDVKKYPTITFHSRQVMKDGERWRLVGDLTMHGVTKPVEIPFTMTGRVHDVAGDVRVGFEGHTQLERKDYGIVGPENFNRVLDLGKLVIGETVDIPLALEGWRAVLRDTMQNHTADSLYRDVLRSGVAPVAKRWRAARGGRPDSLLEVDEAALNSVGYFLLGHQRMDLALGIFQLETEEYSDAAFGWSGLAQAHAMSGNRAEGLAAADKAVALNPGATRAIEIARRLRME